jgi:CRISPR-associated protein Cas1
MKSLIIDKQSASVEVKSGKLYTHKHTVPLKLIDLLILTQNAQIEPKTVLAITGANIPILYLASNSRQFALTLPAISKNSELKIMQYVAQNMRLKIAKSLIYEKLTTHQASLEYFDISIPIHEELAALALAQTIPEVMGIEGAFAKRYFGHFFGLFDRRLAKGYRSKNPPQDPVNALLSYIYTLGYHALTAKLYMRGLDPSISYLHTPFRSHFALSSDLLEPLRAQINNFVAKLFLDGVVTYGDFTLKQGVYLKSTSRRELWKHIIPFMDNMSKQSNTQIINLKRQLKDATSLYEPPRSMCA